MLYVNFGSFEFVLYVYLTHKFIHVINNNPLILSYSLCTLQQFKSFKFALHLNLDSNNSLVLLYSLCALCMRYGVVIFTLWKFNSFELMLSVHLDLTH